MLKQPLFALAAAVLAAAPAVAHEGHGPDGSHWHATDAWGFVALGVVLGVAIWFGRRK